MAKGRKPALPQGAAGHHAPWRGGIGPSHATVCSMLAARHAAESLPMELFLSLDNA